MGEPNCGCRGRFLCSYHQGYEDGVGERDALLEEARVLLDEVPLRLADVSVLAFPDIHGKARVEEVAAELRQWQADVKSLAARLAPTGKEDSES